jgi:hypothetical protein
MAFVVTGIIAYYICVCLLAYGILVLIKRKNVITRLRRQEEERGACVAYEILEDQ